MIIRAAKKSFLNQSATLYYTGAKFGSPDISMGNFFDSTEKFIPLCHE